MGLCPGDEISGGRVLWVGTRKVNCRAATALRMVAQSLHHSKFVLGDFYRRMRARRGAPKAITAAAHKLARIIFHWVTTHHNSMPVISPLIKPVFTNARKANFAPKRELSDPNSSPWNRQLE
jgi:hypothetical protein